MSKKKGKTPQPAAKTMTASAPKMETFTFGEPVPVLDRRDILDYVECISNGRWYEPPISFTGLAKSLRAAVHHSSPIYVKRNILASTFIPHPWLSQQNFSRFVLDFLVFGNAFLEKRYSTTGKVIRLETSPAKYTRRGVEEDVYWWVPSFNEPTPFAPGSVFHCWSRILIRSCTVCRNISAPLTLPG
ncbi:phage portal family protein [Escherichia coli 2770900]|nr:phage portal family protein [Escherichia coli 2770900]